MFVQPKKSEREKPLSTENITVMTVWGKNDCATLVFLSNLSIVGQNTEELQFQVESTRTWVE